MSVAEKTNSGRSFDNNKVRHVLLIAAFGTVAALTRSALADSFSVTSTMAPTGAAISQPLFNQTSYNGGLDYSNNYNASYVPDNFGGPGEAFTPTSNFNVSSITFKGGNGAGNTFTSWNFTLGSIGSFNNSSGSNQYGVTILDQSSDPGTLINTDLTNGNKTAYNTYSLSTPISLTAGTTYFFAFETQGGGYYAVAGDSSNSSGVNNATGSAAIDYWDPGMDLEQANRGFDRTFFINGTPGPQIVYGVTSSNWVHNGNGAYETSSNWSAGVPQFATDTATFDNDGGVITVNPVVTLSSAISLSVLNFNTSAVSYTINGSSGSIATNTINALAGNHTVNTALLTASNTVWTVNVGASLTVTNHKDNVGYYHGEAVTGGGTLTINNLANAAVDIGAGTTVNLTGSSLGMYPYLHGQAIVNITSTGTFGLNQLYDDGSETINIAAGGVLMSDNFGTNASYIGGTINGAGAINVGTISTTPDSLQLTGNNANYSGPIYVTGGSQLRLGTGYSAGGQQSNLWGNDSATNTLTLDNATLFVVPTLTNGIATAFSGYHTVIIAAGGGTIETNDANDTFSTNNATPVSGAFTLGIGSVSGAGTLTVDGGGNLAVAPQTVPANASGGIRTLTLGGLNLLNNSNISFGSSTLTKTRTVLVTGSLSLSGATSAWTSTVDLGNNDMIVRNGNIVTTVNELQQGYASGSWQGSGGILSSAAAADSTHLTALGVILNTADGSTPIYSTFDGVSVGASDVLVKYTYYGDATLDGRVDGSDYSRIDNGYLSHLTGWLNGDFNYDGIINGSDYTLIDNAFNTQGARILAEVAVQTAQIAGTGASSAVPEPATLGLLGIGAVGLLARRKNRRLE